MADALPTTDITGSATAKQTDTIEKASGEKPGQTDAPEADHRIAELARREKALRHRALHERKKAEAQRLEFEAQRKAFETQQSELAELRRLKARLVEEPVAVLNENGVSYNKITDQYLNAPKS